MFVDQRFLAAAKDPGRAQQMLNELHQQILVTKDNDRLSGLLSRYVALATRRASAPPNLHSQYQDYQTATSMLSNIMKQASDNMKAILNNLKS